MCSPALWRAEPLRFFSPTQLSAVCVAGSYLLEGRHDGHAVTCTPIGGYIDSLLGAFDTNPPSIYPPLEGELDPPPLAPAELYGWRRRISRYQAVYLAALDRLGVLRDRWDGPDAIAGRLFEPELGEFRLLLGDHVASGLLADDAYRSAGSAVPLPLSAPPAGPDAREDFYAHHLSELVEVSLWREHEDE